MAMTGVGETLSAFYRKVEQVLKADATLRRAVSTWKAFHPREPVAPAAKGRVAAELFPVIRGQRRYGPTSDEVELAVEVTLAFDHDDPGAYLDLWMAVERAIMPRDAAARNAILASLQALGLQAEPTFLAPKLVVPQADAVASRRYVVAGAIAFHVLVEFNPGV